jgi:hypothetical protein
LPGEGERGSVDDLRRALDDRQRELEVLRSTASVPAVGGGQTFGQSAAASERRTR